MSQIAKVTRPPPWEEEVTHPDTRQKLYLGGVITFFVKREAGAWVENATKVLVLDGALVVNKGMR